MFGVDGGFPAAPDGAIRGRAQPRPAVVEGAVAIRDLAWFSPTLITVSHARRRPRFYKRRRSG